MSYIGNPIVSTDFPVDYASGNGSTTSFTLSVAPASVNSIDVQISGVSQSPQTYTVSGTTLTFSAAPPTGTNNIVVRHLGIAGVPNVPAVGSVTPALLSTANAVYWNGSGNVGIGTTSPTAYSNQTTLAVNGTTYGRLDVMSGGTVRGSFYGGSSGSTVASSGANPLGFETNGTERMRIDSSGNLLVAKTTADGSTQDGLFFQSTGPAFCTVNSTTFNTWHLYNRNATNNGYRFYVNVNGGVNNYSGNNVNLSDERTKTNIEVAGNYLNKICSIPVKLFNYRDEADGEQRTLGVIAQDVEAVAPEFVNVNGWEGEQPKDGIPLKSIYTTDIMFGLMKAIQELNAKVEAQALEIQALKGTV